MSTSFSVSNYNQGNNNCFEKNFGNIHNGFMYQGQPVNITVSRNEVSPIEFGNNNLNTSFNGDVAAQLIDTIKNKVLNAQKRKLYDEELEKQGVDVGFFRVLRIVNGEYDEGGSCY